MKGISTWLFSKVVMLIFLVSVFGIMAGVMSIIKERSFADAAGALSFQIKDAFQGTIASGSLSSQKVVPLPERLPDDVESASPRLYKVEMTHKGAPDKSVSISVAWETSPGQYRYIASSIVYYSGSLKFKPGNSVSVNSSDYRYFVITKKIDAGTMQICVKGCNKVTPLGFSGCTTDLVPVANRC